MNNKILLGYYGGNCFKTGAVFAPNVMLIRTREGLMTNYAFKVVRPAILWKDNSSRLECPNFATGFEFYKLHSTRGTILKMPETNGAKTSSRITKYLVQILTS